MTTNLERLYTAQELAEATSLSACFWREHATRRYPRVPCVRVARNRIRFRASDVAKFLGELNASETSKKQNQTAQVAEKE